MFKKCFDCIVTIIQICQLVLSVLTACCVVAVIYSTLLIYQAVLPSVCQLLIDANETDSDCFHITKADFIVVCYAQTVVFVCALILLIASFRRLYFLHSIHCVIFGCLVVLAVYAIKDALATFIYLYSTDEKCCQRLLIGEISPILALIPNRHLLEFRAILLLLEKFACLVALIISVGLPPKYHAEALKHAYPASQRSATEIDNNITYYDHAASRSDYPPSYRSNPYPRYQTPPQVNRYGSETVLLSGSPQIQSYAEFRRHSRQDNSCMAPSMLPYRSPKRPHSSYCSTVTTPVALTDVSTFERRSKNSEHFPPPPEQLLC